MIKFERLDNILLRGILGKAHSKTPLEFLHLELGTIPIRYTLASRRILFLHNILNRDKSELLYKYYNVQRENSLRGDFHLLVQADMKMVNLDMTDFEIQLLHKSQFKIIVKQKCEFEAFSYLLKLKCSHSKVQSLMYKSHKLQAYLTSNLLNDHEKQTLTGLRSKMVRGIKSNFKKLYSDQSCRLKCSLTHIDNQENLLICKALSHRVDTNYIKYSDIYSNNIYIQTEAAKVLCKLMFETQ